MEKHCHIKYWKNKAMYGKTKENLKNRINV